MWHRLYAHAGVSVRGISAYFIYVDGKRASSEHHLEVLLHSTIDKVYHNVDFVDIYLDEREICWRSLCISVSMDALVFLIIMIPVLLRYTGVIFTLLNISCDYVQTLSDRLFMTSDTCTW